jgi:hypothetical protein
MVTKINYEKKEVEICLSVIIEGPGRSGKDPC